MLSILRPFCVLSAIVAVAAAATLSDQFPSPFLFGAASSAPPETAAALATFGELKLGMFMHDGPVTQWGAEIGWPLVCMQLPCTVQTKRNLTDATPTTRNITTLAELRAHRQQYRDLAKTYNPSSFNATRIAAEAKRAGFKYLVYTTVHCDGFANWDSQVTDYNIMQTPYGKDIFGELVVALRREGLLVGAYICPTLWNSDDFWWPDSLTAIGVGENPTYNTTEKPDLWAKYLETLHGMATEIAAKYAPDLFWFDCHDSPPEMDTMLEQVVGPIRDANPSALVLVRNGPFSDYAELVDKSENAAELVLGQIQTRSGTMFEAGDTLQSSGLWAFDPTSAQRPVPEMLANLMLMTAKGGNYLINIGPGPDGRWAASAEDVLARMASWMAANGEALFGATPMAPYEAATDAGTAFFTSKATAANGTAAAGVDVYVMIPTVAPKADKLVASASERPTGRRHAGPPQQPQPPQHQHQPPLHAAATTLNGGGVMLGTFRSALLSPGVELETVELLGVPGNVKFTQHSNGLQLDAADIIPSPPPAHLQDGAVFKLSFAAKRAKEEL